MGRTWICTVTVMAGKDWPAIGPSWFTQVEAEDPAGARRAAWERFAEHRPHLAAAGLRVGEPTEVDFWPGDAELGL